MRIVSTKEMAKIEKTTYEEYFFDERLLMENVAIQGAKVIQSLLKEKFLGEEIIFLIGRGNNGADGLGVARHLSNNGFRCRAFILAAENEVNDEVKKQMKMASAFHVAVNYIENSDQIYSYFEQMAPKVVVDCIFGTGVILPLSNFIYEIIEYVNDNAEVIFAMDIPTGIEGDTGLSQGRAIEADYTLAVGYLKLGHYVATGARCSGEVKVLDVGFPKEIDVQGDKFLLLPEQMVKLVRARDLFADKKVFGHALVIGGSHGLTGAAAMASSAALRVGSGLVTVATWEPQYQELMDRLIPEVMTGYIPLDTGKWDRLIQDLNKYSSVVIGPGLARSTRARRLVLEVLNNFDGPVVIDADAINVLSLSEDKKVFNMRNAPTVLTPHFGEFAKFAGIEYEEVSRHPVKYLKELVDEINCTVVLKGPCTYIGSTDGNVYFNYLPNDGMATGGVGDVLAGMLGGLLGQDAQIKEMNISLVDRYDLFNRNVALSIYLHSLAGKFAAEKFGVRTMSAGSIIDSLSQAFDALDASIGKVTKGI